MVIGGVIALLGATADMLGLSAQPGIGAAQKAVIGIGLAIVAWGIAGRWPRAAAIRNRVTVAAVSVYVALWTVEVLLTYPLNPRLGFRMPVLGLQGMYENGDVVPVRMTPGYTGVFDDGIVAADVVINSKGERDDEPRPEHPWADRVLLLGDSQTWGHGIAREDMIDSQVEALSNGTLDAYNLSVPGYGAGDIYDRYTESQWWTGKTVVYNFFVNDLQNDNVERNLLVVYDGFPLPRLRPDGEPFTPPQWDRMIADVRKNGVRGGEQNPFRLTFTLVRLRKMVGRALDRDAMLSGYPDFEFGPNNVELVLDVTERMRALAMERGAERFFVVVIPAVGEASAGEYSKWTRAYVEGLRARDFDAVELLGTIERRHYYDHDPHIDAEGSKFVAQAIVDHVGG